MIQIPRIFGQKSTKNVTKWSFFFPFVIMVPGVSRLHYVQEDDRTQIAEKIRRKKWRKKICSKKNPKTIFSQKYFLRWKNSNIFHWKSLRKSIIFEKSIFRKIFFQKTSIFLRIFNEKCWNFFSFWKIFSGSCSEKIFFLHFFPPDFFCDLRSCILLNVV